ncbi:hypothetical protein BREVNS_0557 [Brevinematales bacterium NS]|nr:hypothetical protein BREVNS_0557 [Brevinematales bacterium NS]
MWLVRIKDLAANSQVLGVVVDVMKKTGVTEIQVSSLWRNSEGSPHKEGLGIDITAATRNGVTVRFNNTDNLVPGSNISYANQYDQNIEFIHQLHNAFQNDSRVNQVLDPWKVCSEDPLYSYNNTWREVLNDKKTSIVQYEAMTQEQKREKFNDKERLMIDHRHHLHITIFR